MVSHRIFHSVATPTLIYAQVDNLAMFDALPGKATALPKLLAKSITVDGITIIYQLWMVKSIICPTCKLEKVIDNNQPCPNCNGTGWVNEETGLADAPYPEAA